MKDQDSTQQVEKVKDKVALHVESAKDPEVIGMELKFKLAIKDSNKFEMLFKDLEDNKEI